MVSRLRLQYCKVVIATSLVWFLVDVFLLMYFTDCTMTSQPCDSVRKDRDSPRLASSTMRPVGTGVGFFQKLIPNGECPSFPWQPEVASASWKLNLWDIRRPGKDLRDQI